MLNEADIEVIKELRKNIKYNLELMLENEERTKHISTEIHKELVKKATIRKQKQIKVLDKILNKM